MRTNWKHSVLRSLGHQHYIPRGRDKVIRMLHNPDTSPSIPFEVPFFGTVYFGNLNNFIDWSVFFYGAYARHELYLLRDVAATLRQTLSRPSSFYDIGANIGHHTLFMAPRVGRVFAFEPFEPVRRKLEEKIERNKLTNTTIFPLGLGDSDAELDFSEPSGANQGTGSFVPAEGNRKVSRLQVRNGDHFFASHELPSLDLVKMDVEGFEMRVLRGLRQRILKDRPVILMEFFSQTKAEAGAEKEFREHLYEDARIFSVGDTSISSSYRLKPFSFALSDEILVVPEEKVVDFEGVIF